MNDKTTESEQERKDLEQALSETGHDEDARASIIYALMQFNLGGAAAPSDNRREFIDVIKQAEFVSRQPGEPIAGLSMPGDTLFYLLAGSARGGSGEDGPAIFDKGTVLGKPQQPVGGPGSAPFTAGPGGARLLALPSDILAGYPAVYRSLLGRGLVIAGGGADYELGDSLGDGLNGPVYEILGHKLCAKLLRSRLPDQGDAAAIPEHIMQLRHPHIVSIHETVGCHGLQFIIMDSVSGIDIRSGSGEAVRCRTLRQMLDVFRSQQQRVSLDMTTRMFRHVAAALLFMHDGGFVHRDVKPEHVFIDVCDNEIRFKLSDFSLAFPISTRPRKVVGTPDYCPPEAIDIDKPEALISGAADFYSLAAVCFELLTDQTLFDGVNVLDLAQQHLDAEPDLSRLPDDIPMWLGRFIEQALHKDPARRPERPDIEKLLAVS